VSISLPYLFQDDEERIRRIWGLEREREKENKRDDG
jgi:hypothetical protein